MVRPKISARIPTKVRPLVRLLTSSKELESLLRLLRAETDPLSRQLIWTEAAIKLAELESELAEQGRAS